MKQQRNTTYRAWTWALILVAGLGLGLVRGTRRTQAALPPPPPNTRVVTNTTDNDPGSLRQAIAAAQSGDTITFQLSYPAVITLTTGELVISNKTLTIQGPGAKRLSISGGNASRVLRTDNATVTISHLTVTRGNGGSGVANRRGGGIYQNGGALALVNVAVSGNAGSSGSGGIYNVGGSLTITNSTISNNIGFSAAGILSTGTLLLTNSTISGNRTTGGPGGGIWLDSSSATIINSTISNNTSSNTPFRVRAGGVIVSGASLSLRNTIVAGNRDTEGQPDLVSSTSVVTSNGNNLIGDGTNTFEPVTWQSSDILGQDAKLDPLGDYGGPTETMRPRSDSPALDKDANAGAPATDQRGYGRPYNGGRVDIGAVERGANDDFPVTETNGVITLQEDPATNGGKELIAAIEVANDDPALTTIKLQCGTYSYATAHNWEFGPNALPIIRSPITIEGQGAVLNATEPTRLRFFYVAGNGVGGLATGTLTLQNLTLQNGKQKGGDSYGGGGGAGMGGAIFNHGQVTLERVTLMGNRAAGGNIVNNSLFGGGGMGQDAQASNGGGFGGPPLGVGGQGGLGGIIGGGGGGGGFLSNANGMNGGGNSSMPIGGSGGGQGRLGGGSSGDGGIGGGGGNTFVLSSDGGSYGRGGGSGGSGGGGGVGGGGGGGGGVGGGGFGGGGGSGFGGFGGFGGGGGGGGGFSGGGGGSFGGGGGGLGGAIFNHQGTLTLINCTLTANTAAGGNILVSGGSEDVARGGSGFGGALFNLNGAVTITSSTLAANTVIGGQSLNAPNGGANGGAVYNLAFGNDFTSGGTTTAQVVLRNSILANSMVGNDLVNDRRNGSGTNAATVTFTDGNLVRTSTPLNNGATESGPAPLTSNPNLGMLQTNDCQPAVLPLQSPSDAINAATTDPNVTSDQLGTPRPKGNAPDLGAYEFTATPTITPSAPLSVNAGASLTAAPLATVNDADQNRHTLTVTATLQPGNGSGVTLGTISVDSSGNVTANVLADCSATTSTFTLKVTDNGNLFEVKPLTITVNPDTTLPDTNITGMPASVSDVNVSFTFNGTDNCPTNLTFQCKLDNGGWMPCSSGQSYTNLSFGQHTFSVKARDAAGNEDNSLASYTWTVFAASCGTVVNPATMPAATRGVQFVQTLSASPTGSYVFSLLGGQLPPGISLVNTLGIYSLRGIPTTAGGYTFTIRAKKNNSTCEGARTYTINVP